MEIIINRENRKTLSIRLKTSSIIEVKAPKNLDNEYIYKFIEKHKDRLIKNFNKSNRLNVEFENFKNNGYFLLFGKKSDISFSEKERFIVISKQYLTDRINYFSNLLGFKYSKIEIKGYKTRWGSCDKYKKITLNYKLSMLDKELIDYVIIHELCHLKHLNHSKNFHNLVKSYLQNEQTLRKKLKSKYYLAKI